MKCLCYRDTFGDDMFTMYRDVSKSTIDLGGGFFVEDKSHYLARLVVELGDHVDNLCDKRVSFSRSSSCRYKRVFVYYRQQPQLALRLGHTVCPLHRGLPS